MKKKEIYIIGTTKYSFMIGKFIELEEQYKIIGYVVSSSDIKINETICQKKKVKLFCLEDILKLCKHESIYILNTIGYTNMNSTREKISHLCRENGAHLVNFISKNAINYGVISGTNNIVFPGAYIGTNVMIENDNVIYAGVVLTHDIKIQNNNFIAANSTIGGNVLIENNCFIGMGSTIKNSVSIGKYSLIGAGSFVTNNTNNESVVVASKSVILNKKSSEIIIGG